MPLVPAAGLLALTLLTSAAGSSLQFDPRVCEEASARIELTDDGASPPPVVCLSRGQLTTLRFQSELLREGVRLSQRERFEDMAVGRQSLYLIPPRDLRAGEGFPVEVCSAGGESPRCATLVLVGHPVLSHRQVEVFYAARSPASYKQELAEAKVEAQRYQEELRLCRAERDAPGRLAGGLVSGLIGEHGIARKSLKKEVLERPGSASRVTDMASYRAEGGVAVAVRLAAGVAQAWEATKAVLRGPAGEVLHPLTLWFVKPLAPGKPVGRREGYILLEWVLSGEERALGAYSLVLWDGEGREVVIDDVTFPALSE
jgi:uncharacterized protein (TIGR02268 family)